MKSHEPKKPNLADSQHDQVLATMNAQARLIAQLSAAVTQGFADTKASIVEVEERLDMHGIAVAGDFSCLSDGLSIIEHDTAHVRNDLSVVKDTVSGSERRLGAIERSLDALNRRTDADVQDLLRRMSALETTASR